MMMMMLLSSGHCNKDLSELAFETPWIIATLPGCCCGSFDGPPYGMERYCPGLLQQQLLWCDWQCDALLCHAGYECMLIASLTHCVHYRLQLQLLECWSALLGGGLWLACKQT